MELIPQWCKICDSWTSSEVLAVKSNQKVYVNNVQLSAAILLSGNNFQKFNLFAKFLGLSSISESIFYGVQKLYCQPAIQNMWSNVKETIHGHLPSTGVTLAGDGRNDSPGHTARYCVYTLMEESSKLIVDLEVVDKRETGGKSAAMEKLALSRLLRRLKDVITISHLVTDASTSIKALVRDMKEQHSVLKDLIHDLDVWHKSAKLVKALTEVIQKCHLFAKGFKQRDNYAIMVLIAFCIGHATVDIHSFWSEPVIVWVITGKCKSAFHEFLSGTLDLVADKASIHVKNHTFFDCLSLSNGSQTMILP
ncbi:uncharacterized protein LOC114974540 [Acropora millepora]|uniref:uncharacterized protein LOC114974540 n=1 Tax=Acropora millepora TaxID=45264 RepID=UPI001CF5FCB9|nr:uncharacterized protein LOC114974540 [Acropora millepora]